MPSPFSPLRWRRRSVALAVLGLALAVTLVLLLARVWVPHDELRERERWREVLEAIADDRARGVELWVAERLADLQVLGEFPTTRELLGLDGAISDGHRHAGDEDAVEHFALVLEPVARAYGYRGIWLLAHDGQLVTGTGGAPPDSVFSLGQRVVAAAAPASTFFVGPDGPLVAVAAPVTAVDGRLVAVMVVASDPRRQLYPLLAAATPGCVSCEALLVVPDGDEMLRFASPLRHVAAAPATLRVRREPGIYGTAALVGRRTFGQYTGVRGVPVLAATRPVAATDWGLVVKVDEAEAMAPHREGVRTAGLALLATLLSIGAFGLVVWRAYRGAVEQRLQGYQREMARLLDLANDALLLIDRRARIIYASRRAEDLYDRPAASLAGVDVAALRADGDREASRQIGRAIEEAGSLVFEAAHRRADGRQVDVEVSVAKVGEVGDAAYLAIVRDVSERKAAERMRSGELRVLELIAAGTPLEQTLGELAATLRAVDPGKVVALLWCADDGPCRAVAAGGPSGLAEELATLFVEPGPVRQSFGVLPEDVELQPRGLGDATTLAPLRALAERYGLGAGWALPLGAVGGQAVGCLLVFRPQPSPPDAVRQARWRRVAQLAAIAIQQRSGAEALRRREAELAAVFEHAAVAIALVGADGRVVRANPALGSLLHRDAATLVGVHFADFTHPEDRARDEARFRALMAGEIDSYQLEKRYVRADGSLVLGRLTASLVRGGDGSPPIAVGLVEDVTEERRLAEQVQVVQRIDAIGRLAGGVAHDFNNILAVILGLGEQVLRGLAADHPTRSKVVEMLAAADRAAQLTRQLLAFSRRQMLDVELLDLNVVVGESSRILRRLLGEDVSLELALETAIGRVRADRSQLDQVVMNLAVNARDAMPAGGRLTIATDEVALGEEFVRTHPGSSPGDYVRLSVRDDGEGIPPDVLPRIFEPFFTTKPNGQGTGLGLSMVYGIVKQSGGYVEVTSELGKGTEFHIYLPRAEEGEEEGRAPRLEAEPAEPVGGAGETILVAEDEPLLRELIVDQLESRGYRVLSAEHVAEALRLAHEHDGRIDALLTDIVMPDGNGRELARQVVAIHPGIAVVFMSGYTDDVLARTGALEGDLEAAVLAKPFTAATLAEKLREVLASRRHG